jgi:hypothetical protein
MTNSTVGSGSPAAAARGLATGSSTAPAWYVVILCALSLGGSFC